MTDLNQQPAKTQRVILTIGCPGAGKDTFASTLNPREWVRLSLDGVRTMLFGSKKAYFANVGEDPLMRVILHQTYQQCLRVALRSGRNVIMVDTHLWPSVFRADVQIIEGHGFVPELLVFDTALDVLLERNAARGDDDKMPEDDLRRYHAAFCAADAWWRERPYTYADGAAVEPPKAVEAKPVRRKATKG